MIFDGDESGVEDIRTEEGSRVKGYENYWNVLEKRFAGIISTINCYCLCSCEKELVLN